MTLKSALAQIDAGAARAFVQAARNVIDAMLIEHRRVAQANPPAPRDYNDADVEAGAAPGGWISDAELHDTTRRLAEAVAAEKWADGALLAIRLLARLG